MCELSLIYVCNIVLPIIDSSMQVDVYTILCLSEISPPRAHIFPDLVFLTSPYEQSTDPIPSIFEVTLQATKPRTLVGGKKYF